MTNEQAIELLKDLRWGVSSEQEDEALDMAIEALSAQPEPLTDKEQRIFLAAMGREREVCKQVDEECRDCREPYEDSLVRICNEIRKEIKDFLANYPKMIKIWEGLK